MSEEIIKRQLDQLKDLVIFSATRINYLLQVIELSEENNRIIRRFDGFYAMVARDFGGQAIISIRALHESRPGTHNLKNLIETINKSDFDMTKKSALESVVMELESIDDVIPKKVTILASVKYAHKSIKSPSKEVIVTFVEMQEYLARVGELLNKISGIMWGSSTLMHMPDSEGESFIKEMQHIEIAEDIGTWIQRKYPEHEVVEERTTFIKKMKEKI